MRNDRAHVEAPESRMYAFVMREVDLARNAGKPCHRGRQRLRFASYREYRPVMNPICM